MELRGIKQARPPVWIMRQAGRYLPEYRQIRETVGSFLELCYTPALAAEVTLQPIRRFDLDGAILFSDILVVPDALGQRVTFEQGEGPVLGPLDLKALDPARVAERLAPVMETVRRVRSALTPDKTLIGFCGGPWTVATYMIGGRGSPDQAAARIFALQQPEAFAALIDILVEASAAYLRAQLEAGADVVQIFESWAGNLDDAQFRERVIEPNRRIVDHLRRTASGNPVVTGFPRGAGPQLSAYAEAVGIDCIGLDTTMPPTFADSVLPKSLTVQGNLDPIRLLAGGAQMEDAARGIIAAFQNRPHVFNLGHGILPETPIANVHRLIRAVRGE